MRDKQQYSSARSIPSRRRGKRKAMAGRSSRRAAPPCRHPGSAGSTAGTPSLASPFQVRTRQRILVAPARRLQFLDSPLFATARSGRKKRKRRTEQIRPLAIKKNKREKNKNENKRERILVTTLMTSPDHQSGRVRSLRISGQKILAQVRPMTWSGRVGPQFCV